MLGHANFPQQLPQVFLNLVRIHAVHRAALRSRIAPESSLSCSTLMLTVNAATMWCLCQKIRHVNANITLSSYTQSEAVEPKWFALNNIVKIKEIRLCDVVRIWRKTMRPCKSPKKRTLPAGWGVLRVQRFGLPDFLQWCNTHSTNSNLMRSCGCDLCV